MTTDTQFHWRVSSYSNDHGGECIEVGWRTSSYSNDHGGSCVEVAWRTSTHSNDQGGSCVEVALAPTVAFRDTKDRTAATAYASAAAWTAFLGAATGGYLADPTHAS
ncbi:DUF397 domain-containing protein [Streptomyces sp. NPDC049881]|uniref:DUF397 domain-containing protein n=1 Tax=Streptomyces sp. NPDC049881 TaxID=3155778 RepID=UPI003424551B